ncbi:MAG: hypothetical protein ACOY7U_00925 [Acidobacteriota bacterium]|nr:MAG: hypothetical protein KatS3mg007_0325 [Thermoanaerobaculum sp.]
MAFDLVKLLRDVFAPERGEVVTVACDVPRKPEEDHPSWADRRAWAEEWRQAFLQLGAQLGFATNPLLAFPATGANGAPLPELGQMGDKPVKLEEVLLGSTLAVFLTEYSATAPLDAFTKKKQDFRAASLPGVERRMVHTALAADYREVARRCRLLFEAMCGASGLEVVFSTGHSCFFDLRFRQPEVDDGFLPRNKEGDRIINLPSGETFIVPYEGEKPGQPSQTEGEIPWVEAGELVVFVVKGNRIVEVRGEGPVASRFRQVFASDPARTNVAEVAFGCNPKAAVTGIVLEDEKAGFHWAYGRSDHLGGSVGVAAFLSPQTVVHQDLVYAQGNPVTVAEAYVLRGSERLLVMRNGNYTLF